MDARLSATESTHGCNAIAGTRWRKQAAVFGRLPPFWCLQVRGSLPKAAYPLFRDAGGFWERFPVEEFRTWSGLWQLARTQPSLLADYLIERLGPIAHARPNPAHYAVKAMNNAVR